MSAPGDAGGEGAGARSHHTPRGFRNPWPGADPHGFLDFVRWVLLDPERRQRRREPPDPGDFPRATPAFAEPRAAVGLLGATWVGHSTVLLQIGGRNVLTDPMWSARASPVQWAGPRRYTPPGFPLDALPPLDVVLLSHDHYDHLDRSTVRRLARAHPAAEWVAPLGLAGWLRRAGVPRMRELDWWEETEVAGLTVGCTPAQHFSGRRAGPLIADRDRTLWCGFAVRERRAGGRAVLYAGDTARHPEWARLARRWGPFDLVLLPIGAYDPRWFMRPVHMDPEDALAAYAEIAGAQPGRPPVMMGVHWGTFVLTDEPAREPAERTARGWTGAPDALWIPVHGETRVIPPAIP